MSLQDIVQVLMCLSDLLLLLCASDLHLRCCVVILSAHHWIGGV